MIAVIRLGALLALPVLLSGCGGDALVYGERTSVDVASIRLGDDVAQPVRINLGFDRQVAMIAPALGGTTADQDSDVPNRVVGEGEAVSQFSTFTVGAEAAFVGGDQNSNLLRVQSRFASGAAALAIADKPEVVAALMGFTPTTFGPDATTEALRAIFEVNPETVDKAQAFLQREAPLVALESMVFDLENAQLRRDVLAHLTQ